MTIALSAVRSPALSAAPRQAEARREVPARLKQAAGTLAAKNFQTDEFIVEGPSAFTPGLAEHKAGSGLLTKAALAFHYMGASTKGYAKVTGAQLEALTRPGPSGQAPKLQPGDFIVTGRDGNGGHLALYAGHDATTGKPTIIHAMATQFENLGLAKKALEVGRLLTTGHGKTGVFREALADFYERSSHDAVYVMRDERLTPAMRARGFERVQELLGRPYDYNLQLGDEALYCSELAVEFLKAAYEGSGKTLPWIGTARVDETRLGGAAGIHQWVAKPENFGASPDLMLTATVGRGAQAFRQVSERYVTPEKRGE